MSPRSPYGCMAVWVVPDISQILKAAIASEGKGSLGPAGAEGGHLRLGKAWPAWSPLADVFWQSPPSLLFLSFSFSHSLLHSLVPFLLFSLCCPHLSQMGTAFWVSWSHHCPAEPLICLGGVPCFDFGDASGPA